MYLWDCCCDWWRRQGAQHNISWPHILVALNVHFAIDSHQAKLDAVLQL